MSRSGTPPLLRAALAAAERGWPVLPLFPGSKRPAITGWQHHATRDPAVLAAWWERRPYNIGIACGPAGLLVVDIDHPHATALGSILGGEPGPTYRVRTPRGVHLYFSVDAARPGRTTAGLLGSGVDTRAVGGYVVAAGSTRRISGWTITYRPLLPELEPAPAPDALLTRLAPALPVRPRLLAVQHPAAYVRAALDGEARRIGGAGTGERNTAVFTAAVRLGRFVAGGLLDRVTLVDHLADAAAAHVGVDGFTAGEADRAIANGLRYSAALDT